jgi:glycosyltransferase involved in cell wall biosynthesis
MKVLLVNKFFYPRAGAETAFFHTRDLLRAHGHDVIDFGMQDPQNVPSEQSQFFAPARSYGSEASGLQRLRDAGTAVYSLSARRALGRLLDIERPDVAHLHNIYHQLTLSVVDELYRRRIPIVQTLHDWKIACPSYNLFTEGAPCRRCVDSTVLSAIKHRCIKGSASASAIAASEAAIAHRRGTYHRIERYIAPSGFARSVALAAGIQSSRIDVLPYLMPDEELGTQGNKGRRDPVFFHGGRLDETKGVRQLLAAFEAVPAPARLQIAGWGSLQDEVENAAARNPRIEFLGALSRAEVLAALDRSRVLLLPSIWEDNCPLVMLEAQARSTPAIVSNRGGLPEFVVDGQHGFVIDPEDIGAFAARITQLSDDPLLAAEMGSRGRDRLMAEHRAESHYEGLLGIYEKAQAGQCSRA